jgi:hypothetical protein
MAANLTPTARGVLGVLLGLFLIGLTIYLAKSKGAIYLFPCLVGPAVIPISLATLALRVDKLYKPTERDGKLIYDTAGINHTPLGWLLILVGFAGSGIFYWIVSNGF